MINKKGFKKFYLLNTMGDVALANFFSSIQTKVLRLSLTSVCSLEYSQILGTFYPHVVIKTVLIKKSVLYEGH